MTIREAAIDALQRAGLSLQQATSRADLATAFSGNQGDWEIRPGHEEDMIEALKNLEIIRKAMGPERFGKIFHEEVKAWHEQYKKTQASN